MADKSMYIPNDCTQNLPSYRLIIGFNVWFLNLMNESTKIQQKPLLLLSQRIRKNYNKTLVTSIINIPMSPSSLVHVCFALIIQK